MLSASFSRFVQRPARNEAVLPVSEMPEARPGGNTPDNIISIISSSADTTSSSSSSSSSGAIIIQH